ncbi:MAG TPA: beta-L-arabinofuranosidase domain-containing protein [Blastocatellia bacterium]|nr:beta-L-arabinofuranosidase domain-containing protein [Blastocatellia bacterium]
MKKRLSLVAMICTFLASWGSAVASRAVESQKIKVPNKVPLQAVPFDLTDVRLLEGPFRQAMLRDQNFLLSIDTDRLLHNFRVNAGLPSSAKPYGGWEAPDVELRGHSLGHFLTACALMYASTGDARFKTKADAVVAELAKIQEAMPQRGFHPGYLSAFPEEFIDRVEKRVRVWAPYYTLHKIMAGLLDMYLYCDNRQALDILIKMADWVKFRMDRLSEDQQQRMLETEYGGMNDVLANLYAVTGNPEHLRLARLFDHKALFDPLARGEDPLNGLHGNTQIPKMIGAAREYELTGERRYADIATFFWRRVALFRSYVIGGNTDGERFFPIEQFSRRLGPATTETCNTYNMLKLTRHLFSWNPSAEYMDFYERALFNHILASQDPATGMMCYYVPLRPGAFRTYSRPEDSFWCCVGTGMENHAKYGDTIYFHDDRSIYVNLFIASEVTWREKGITVRQETRFPEEDATRLIIKAARPVRLAVKIRYPSWAVSGMTLTVNGRRETVAEKPGSYVTLDREWKDGDRIDVRLPMSLRLEAMPDDPKMIAVLYGPIVLGGDLGTTGLTEAERYGPSAPRIGRVPPVEVPAFVAAEVKDVLTKIKPVAEGPLTFRTEGLAQPREVTLLPFYKLHDRRYTVYWKVYTPAEWEKRKAEIAAREARRREIERLTLDAVNINDPASEREHGFQGENSNEGFFEGRRWRAARNGWFSYQLKGDPTRPLTLVCTYRGSEGPNRVFDILVEGEKIATERLEMHPTELFDVEYPLPEALTRGKERITVKFQAHPNALTGAVFDVRLIPREQK